MVCAWVCHIPAFEDVQNMNKETLLVEKGFIFLVG